MILFNIPERIMFHFTQHRRYLEMRDLPRSITWSSNENMNRTWEIMSFIQMMIAFSCIQKLDHRAKQLLFIAGGSSAFNWNDPKKRLDVRVGAGDHDRSPPYCTSPRPSISI